jgi:hypothetical protein
MPKSKPTPWDLHINLWQPDPDDPNDATVTHASIEVGADGPDAFADASLAEITAAYQWAAGILGRLAAALAEDLTVMRREHGNACVTIPSRSGELGCGAWLLDPLPPAFDSPPILAVELRADSTEIKDLWLPKVQDALERILASSRWQPTPEDEAEWAAG